MTGSLGSDSEVATSARPGQRPPGALTALLSAVAVAALLCVYYDWWPSSANLTDAGKFVIAVPAIVLLVAAGLTWIVRTVSFIRRTRRWAWECAAVPLLLLAALLVGVVVRPPTFDSERAKFDQIAQQVISAPGDRSGARDIGGIDIRSVELQPDGCVYFTAADSAFGATRGWVFAPNRRPAARKFDTLKDVGEGWYEFKYGT